LATNGEDGLEVLKVIRLELLLCTRQNKIKNVLTYLALVNYNDY
jgi:hypothetical protein